MELLIPIFTLSALSITALGAMVLNTLIAWGGYRSVRQLGYYPVASTVILICVVVVPLIAMAVYFRRIATSGEGILSYNVVDALVISGCFALLAILPALAFVLLVRVLPKRAVRVSGRRTEQFPAIKLGFTASGYLIYTILIAAWIFGIYRSILKPEEPWELWLILVSTFTIVFLPSGRELIWRGKHYQAEQSIEEVIAEDLRPPVMFLRSFAAESDPFVSAPLSEFPDLRRYIAENAEIDETAHEVDPIVNIPLEQYLAKSFGERIGPYVALGNPEDYLPPRGATRTYIDDEDWYEYFMRISKQAACIVMPVINSRNLERELSFIRQEGIQQRLFILITPTRVFQPKDFMLLHKLGKWLYICGKWLWTTLYGTRFFPDYGINWASFSDMLKKLGFELCDYPGLGAVITFDSAGKAKLLMAGAVTPIEFVEPICEYLNQQSVTTSGITHPGTGGVDDTSTTSQTGTAEKSLFHPKPYKLDETIVLVALFSVVHLVIRWKFSDYFDNEGYIMVGIRIIVALLISICIYFLLSWVESKSWQNRSRHNKVSRPGCDQTTHTEGREQ